MINFKKDTFTFGKFKDELIEDVEDIEYFQWLIDEGEMDITDEITELFVKNIEDRIEELS